MNPVAFTPEQQAKIPEWIDRWIKIGLSCEPADWETAEKGVIGCYEAADMAPPKLILRAGSPYAAVTRGPVADMIYAPMSHEIVKSGFSGEEGVETIANVIGERVISWAKSARKIKAKNIDQVPVEARRKVLERLVDKAHELIPDVTRRAVSEQWMEYRQGSMLAHWYAYITFLRDICGWRDQSLEAFAYDEMVGRSASWWWLGEDVVVISDRPAEIHLDADQLLHSEEGMAIRFRDGWGIYALHGVKVPEKVVVSPEKITVAEIDGEVHAEVRRLMTERFGPSRYFQEGEAEILDMDSLPHVGSAPRALIRMKSGDKWLVGTDGSTARVYNMPAPETAQTCREAHRLIAGFDEDRLIGEA